MVTARQAFQARRHLDRRLSALGPVDRYLVPKAGWIRAIREALGMSASVLAKRLGITAQAVLATEISEAEGRIRIDTLRRAADALDCVLVYALLPKDSLSDTIERQAERLATEQRNATAVSMALEDQAVTPDAEAVKRQVKAIIETGRVWRDSPQ